MAKLSGTFFVRTALALGAGVLAIGLAVPEASAERVLERLSQTDLPGFDYRTLRNVPLAQCETACLADRQCAAFTYNERAGWCFLKSEAGERTPYANATSAIVRQIDTTPALPMPDTAYLPASYQREAASLEAELANALATGRFTARIDEAAANALSGGSSGAWTQFAGALMSRQYPEFRERQGATRTAGAAAWLGLREARTPEAQGAALAVLSNVLEQEGLFRPAITASEASVTLRFDAAEQARLERLRTAYGFRVLDYAVDAESAAPRLCVQFSERLRGDAAALQRFVTLDGVSDPALTVEDSQLCVEGLDHGARYEITVREGLPSVTGELLRKSADFRAYVRDRAPLARFDTNDYVLPASARGVPITTINSDEVDLALYRVNDRNLAEVVRRGDFKRQLWTYEADQIAQERGAKVWSGKMAIEPVLNEEVRTLVPVAEMIGTLEPGVYVLTAIPVEQADRSQSLATQWFVISDLGLSTFSNGRVVDVFARSLASATPTEGVTVSLLAANDEVLASGLTDAEGYVRLESRAPLEGGQAPAVVTAEAGENDYVFLSLSAGAFELTDRGVAGRTAPGPVDAFLATERGVYRGGESVNVTALVRSDSSDALALPLTLKVTRPDGVLSRRLVERSGPDGGLAFQIDLTTNAATGTWQLSAHVDPEGPAVGTTSFLVEDFVPQRIEVALSTQDADARQGETVPLTVEADFLYGAPAGDLMLAGEVVLSQTTTLEGFEGYSFGLSGEVPTPQRTPLEDLPRTGPDGTARFEARIGVLDGATGPVSARIVVSVREPGGRSVQDAITLPVITDMAQIGVRPLFENGEAREGADAGFELIAIDAERDRIALDATWTLTRIERDYQWYRRNGSWFYDAVERFERVATGDISLDQSTPTRISAPVEWGRYRLEVTSADGTTEASYGFSAGWIASGEDADTPDVLEVSLDKAQYEAGETALLRISPRAPGTALVTVLSQDVAFATTVDVPAEGAEVEIPVSADWAPGAYVAATLFRGGTGTVGGPPLPERSIGIAYLDVDTADRRLSVSIDVPQVAEPRGMVDVPVVVAGLSPGETARMTVAAVDVGILNLTGFEAPDPTTHFLGQRRLAVELRDIYGDLIDASGAALGRVRSGGDGVASGSAALPPTEDPVSLFSGIIEADEDGVATASFDLPAFNGTLRVMAIVWTETKVGNASADMLVRDPVVLAGSLPRFLAPGDATRLRFDLHNVAHEGGRYSLEVETSGPIAIDGGEETLDLATDERDSIEFPIAATGIGLGEITARLTGPGDLSLTKDFRIAVRSAAPQVSERRLLALAPGERAVLAPPATLGFSEDATVSVAVGTGAIDPAGLIQSLDRFPFGCAEQTVSRALPLLYLNEVAENVGLSGDADASKKIRDAISRVLSFQSSSGGFGLWSPGYDLWLTAYVMDFMSRAREAGYSVPDDAFEAGLDRLQSVLSFIGDLDGERGTDIAYATYVLARNGRAAIGDLRYFAQEKLDAFTAPLARAQLAASLSFTGEQGLADSLFREALHSATLERRPDRTDFGTPLRDAAAIVTLAAESRAPNATVTGLAGRLSDMAAATSRTLSTQEMAWLLLSANATQDRSGSVFIADTETNSPAVRSFDEAASQEPIAVENLGIAPIGVAATVTGTPIAPLPPVQNGLTVTRTYHALDGSELALDQVAQNTRLVVRLTYTKTAPDPMRILLVDLLPAGLEIENPRLLSSGEATGVALVQTGQSPEHTEFRDDRFAAAWTLSRGNENTPITVSYLARAVSPGTFMLPAVEVSDMYQPRFVARGEAGTLAVLPTR